MLQHLYFFAVFYIPCTLLLPIPLIFLAYLSNTDINKLYTSFVIKYPLLTSYEIINPSARQSEGIIIANHKSGFDNLYDSHVTHSVLIADTKVRWYHGLVYLLQAIYKQIIVFDKTATTRHQIYKQMKDSGASSLLFYPEGTRVRIDYKKKEDIQKHIKYGLLKSIYERNDYPVQLFISKNKEKVFNNKPITPVHIKSIYGSSFWPKSYDSFELFIDEIITQWIECLEELN